MRVLPSYLRLFSFVALLPLLLGAVVRPGDERAKYEQKKGVLELECAQRHLDLGLWCRDKGYVAASEEQILEAVEVSNARHAHANACQSLIRRIGKRFWKKSVDVTSSRQKAIDKKLAKVLKQNRGEWFQLAEWAFDKGLEEEALGTFEGMIDPERPLDVDSKGRIATEAGKIPAACAELILANTIRINGEPYLRSAVLKLLPNIDELHQASTPTFVVNTTSSSEDAESFHALGAELVPRLEDELRMQFSRRPGLMLFPTRKEYESYLVEAGLQSYRAVSGFADVRRFTTVVCTEGLSALTVQGLVLHELSHLADHDAFPQAMPAWYREGFAESFGGSGTFAWDGLHLELKREMDHERLLQLKRPGGLWPIEDMLRIDPLSLWGSDHDTALRFYAQCWALYRWLSRDAPGDLRGRWEDWIADCKAAEISFPPARERVQSPDELFVQYFSPVYGEIDDGLADWLEDR